MKFYKSIVITVVYIFVSYVYIISTSIYYHVNVVSIL